MTPSSTKNPTITEANLSDAQLTTIRDILVTERSAETMHAQVNRTTVTELTGQSDVDSILEREVAEAAALRSDLGIADIDSAIALIDAGTYGRCDKCGSPIAFGRLEAIPRARLCVGCSQVRSGLLG